MREQPKQTKISSTIRSGTMSQQTRLDQGMCIIMLEK